MRLLRGGRTVGNVGPGGTAQAVQGKVFVEDAAARGSAAFGQGLTKAAATGLDILRVRDDDQALEAENYLLGGDINDPDDKGMLAHTAELSTAQGEDAYGTVGPDGVRSGGVTDRWNKTFDERRSKAHKRFNLSSRAQRVLDARLRTRRDSTRQSLLEYQENAYRSYQVSQVTESLKMHNEGMVNAVSAFDHSPEAMGFLNESIASSIGEIENGREKNLYSPEAAERMIDQAVDVGVNSYVLEMAERDPEAMEEALKRGDFDAFLINDELEGNISEASKKTLQKEVSRLKTRKAAEDHRILEEEREKVDDGFVDLSLAGELNETMIKRSILVPEEKRMWIDRIAAQKARDANLVKIKTNAQKRLAQEQSGVLYGELAYRVVREPGKYSRAALMDYQKQGLSVKSYNSLLKIRDDALNSDEDYKAKLARLGTTIKGLEDNLSFDDSDIWNNKNAAAELLESATVFLKNNPKADPVKEYILPVLNGEFNKSARGSFFASFKDRAERGLIASSSIASVAGLNELPIGAREKGPLEDVTIGELSTELDKLSDDRDLKKIANQQWVHEGFKALDEWNERPENSNNQKARTLFNAERAGAMLFRKQSGGK